MECIRGLFVPHTADKLLAMYRIVDELTHILQRLYNGERFSWLKRVRIHYLHVRFVFLQRSVVSRPITYQEDLQFLELVREFRSAIACLHIFSKHVKRRGKTAQVPEPLLL